MTPPTFTSHPKDRLDHLFKAQDELNRRLKIDTNCMSDEERIRWILNFVRASSQELAELTDSVPWKWWSKPKDPDWQNIRVELVDILHFWISLCQVAGMTPEDVFRIYMAKNKVNHTRQDDGYDVTTKTEDDNRSIV